MALNQLGLGMTFSATDLASGVMAKVRGSFANTREEMAKFAASTKTAFKQFGAGASLMTSGIAYLGALSVAAESSMEFSRSIAEVATEIDAATFSQEQMKEVTREMALTFGKMPLEESAALYDAVAFGANNAAKSTALLSAANQLAVAGVTDVKTALSAVAGTVKSYNLDFDKSADISDAFFKAMTLGKTKVADLATALPKVTGQASSLGISYETLLAATSTLTGRNVEAAEAVTGLKAAFANIQKPTSDAEKEARRLGITFNADTFRKKGLPTFLEEITTNSKFTANTLGELFGSVEAGNAIIQLTSGGMKDFKDILAAMQDRAGATKRGFDVMSQTLDFQRKRFDALRKIVLDTIGEALEPMGAKLVSFASSILETWNKLPKATRDTVVRIVAAAAAFATLAGAVISAIAAAKIFASALSFVGIGASSLASIFGPAIALIGVLVLAFEGAKVAYEKNLGGFAMSVNSIVEPIKTAWTALVQLFTTGTLDEGLTQQLLKGDNAAVNFAVKVKQVADNILEFFSSIGSGFEEGIAAAKPVFAAFGASLDRLREAFAAIVGPVDLVDEGFESAGSAGSTVGKIFAKVSSVIMQLVSGVIDVVTGFLQVWGEVSSALSTAGDAFSEVGSAIGELINQITGGNDSAGNFSVTLQSVGQVLGSVLGVAINIVASLIKNLAVLIKDIAMIFGGVVDIIAGIATGKWDRVWRGLGKIVYGVVAGIVDAIMGVVQVVIDTVDAISKALGKDLGWGKGLQSFRDRSRAQLKDMLVGADASVAGSAPAAPKAAPVAPATVAAPTGTATPAAASVPPKLAGDPHAAAAAAAKAAVAALPPTHVTATLQVDGEVLGRLALKGNASEASRSGGPVPVAVAG